MSDPALCVKLADDLLVLEKGSDELLLTNGLQRRPLYVKEGRRYITRFLKAAAELGTRPKITAAYPHDVNLLQLLLDYGILVPSGAPPGGRPSEASPKLPPPGGKQHISLYLLLSQSCNMGCIYCLDGKTTYQTDKGLRMGPEVAFRSIDHCLNELVDGGYLEVIFFGGEPLLAWPLAKEVILFCENRLAQSSRRKRRQYHFTSNLTLLPHDLIEWAKRYGISFLCDIDGPPAIHDRCRPFKDGRGSFEAVARSIGRLRDAGLRVNLRATVTSLNHDRLPEIAEIHKRVGGSSCAFVPVMPVNSDESVLPESLLPSLEKILGGMAEVYHSGVWGPEELFPFNQYASRFEPGTLSVVGCGAPFGNTPVVTVTGDVYPCIYLVGLKRFYAGNIMDSSYPDRNLLDRMYGHLHVDRVEDCRQCAWRYLCCGGCPVGRLTVMDNPQATEGIKEYCRRMQCDYTKGILELLLWKKATEVASEDAADTAHATACV